MSVKELPLNIDSSGAELFYLRLFGNNRKIEIPTCFPKSLRHTSGVLTDTSFNL